MVEAYVALLNFGEALSYSKKVIEIHKVLLATILQELASEWMYEKTALSGDLLRSEVTPIFRYQNVESSSVRLEGLHESAHRSTVVSQRLQRMRVQTASKFKVHTND
nr:hypothetical protein [Tanacetum cinerariifolium]